MTKHQPLAAKKGEVNFRRKLYQDLLSDKSLSSSAKFKETLEGTKRHQKNARRASPRLFLSSLEESVRSYQIGV